MENKNILLNLSPKVCESISIGNQKIIIQKKKPKIQVPFVVYIYCKSSDIHNCLIIENNKAKVIQTDNYKNAILCGGKLGNGFIIGQFICNNIYSLKNVCTDSWNRLQGELHDFEKGLVKKANFSESELHNYAKNKNCFAWNISDFKVYKNPKKIDSFFKQCSQNCENCIHWNFVGVNQYESDFDCEFFDNRIPIDTPPKTWIYVDGTF